ncbi:hypothetical protein [Achromobacter xylosoxidans]|uniref:hypothetical protein n=1 Tax=Alcaligenes xylosoxydans xylosoxydans TaxID=85698 RepID=UPI0010414D01|nr:hypothetical protein [Achromobacter xylosoxidans]
MGTYDPMGETLAWMAMQCQARGCDGCLVCAPGSFVHPVWPFRRAAAFWRSTLFPTKPARAGTCNMIWVLEGFPFDFGRIEAGVRIALVCLCLAEIRRSSVSLRLGGIAFSRVPGPIVGAVWRKDCQGTYPLFLDVSTEGFVRFVGPRAHCSSESDGGDRNASELEGARPMTMDRLVDVDAFPAGMRMPGRQPYTGPIQPGCELENLKGVKNAA